MIFDKWYQFCRWLKKLFCYHQYKPIKITIWTPFTGYYYVCKKCGHVTKHPAKKLIMDNQKQEGEK